MRFVVRARAEVEHPSAERQAPPLSVGVNRIDSVVSSYLAWIVLLLPGRRTTRKDVLALGIPIVIFAAVFTSNATAFVYWPP